MEPKWKIALFQAENAAIALQFANGKCKTQQSIKLRQNSFHLRHCDAFGANGNCFQFFQKFIFTFIRNVFVNFSALAQSGILIA